MSQSRLGHQPLGAGETEAAEAPGDQPGAAQMKRPASAASAEGRACSDLAERGALFGPRLGAERQALRQHQHLLTQGMAQGLETRRQARRRLCGQGQGIGAMDADGLRQSSQGATSMPAALPMQSICAPGASGRACALRSAASANTTRESEGAAAASRAARPRDRGAWSLCIDDALNAQQRRERLDGLAMD